MVNIISFKNKIFPFIIGIILVGSQMLSAQENLVKGKVTIWNDIPLQNIIVFAKKSKQETKTDGQGYFVIKIGGKDKLRFSAEGFIDKRLNVKAGDDNLHVKMGLLSNDFTENDELSNDGFRFIPQKYRAAAIRKLEDEIALEMSAYNTVWDMIKGRCPGVIVADDNVYIREGSKLNLSNESQPATIVVNGIQVSGSILNDINPVNVKSVSFLKGGAAAVYGGSGGNGVVVIKLK